MDDLAFGLRTAALGITLVVGLLAALWLLLELVLRLDHGDAVDGGESGAAVGGGRGAAAAGESRARLAVTPAAPSAATPDPDLVAAIAIAVERHTEERRREAAPAMRAYWPGSLLYASRWVASGRTRQNRAWQRGGRP